MVLYNMYYPCKCGTTHKDLIKAVAESSGLSEDDIRVVEHVELVENCIGAFYEKRGLK